MKTRSKWLLPVLILLLTPLLQAQTRFGAAVVERGSLWILRDGSLVENKAAKIAIPLLQNDLLRTSEQADVLLSAADGGTMTLGGNAVVLVQAWQEAKQGGFLKMIYGKARIKTGTDRPHFTLQTPTAVLAISGTVRLQLDAFGNALSLVEEGRLYVARPRIGQWVAVNELIVAIGERPFQLIRTLPPDLLETLKSDGLEAPPAESTAAGTFGIETKLVAGEFITSAQLEESRKPDVEDDDPFDTWQKDAKPESTAPTDEPVSSPLTAAVKTELEKTASTAPTLIEPITTTLGTHWETEAAVEDVFAAYEQPKTPETIINLDDKTGWSAEAGLISISLEK